MTDDRFASRLPAETAVDRNEYPTPAAGPDGAGRSALGGLFASVCLAGLGAARDRLACWRLSRLSDRMLADMGLSREALAGRLAAARRAATARRGALISQRLAAWREERRIYRELSHYSDAELSELGMGRRDIRAAARGHAVMLFRDAGLVDRYLAAAAPPPAANQPAPRRAA